MTILEHEVQQAMDLQHAHERLSVLDLTMIRMKLADPKEGQGWSVEQLDLHEREYRRFLVLNLIYPREQIVPCLDVDMVWHAHILDTAAYRADCDAVFGEFFDHFPYFGMRGDADAAQLIDAYDRTIDLYELVFGSVPDGVWTIDHTMKCTRKNCKPQRCKGAN